MDARCQSTRNANSAINRHVTMLIRPRKLCRFRLARAVATVPMLEAGSTAGTFSVFAALMLPNRRFARQGSEFRLIGNHPADALPQVRTQLEELGPRPEIVAPAR